MEGQAPKRNDGRRNNSLEKATAVLRKRFAEERKETKKTEEKLKTREQGHGRFFRRSLPHSVMSNPY
jgi:hypothetical protein